MSSWPGWFIAISLALVVLVANGSPPKLYVFDCGVIRHTTITQYGLGDDDTDVRDLFVPCYLIEHGDQKLLWDGGLPLEYAGQPEFQWDEVHRVVYERSVIDQLADLGIRPDDVDFVAFSHFHIDHNGAANAFADSHHLIQRAEHEAAFAEEDINPLFVPALYDKLKDADMTVLDGDHDVFGDGHVEIISAPGHTPGHQVLFVDLAQYGPLVLSGDLYHFEKSRKVRAVPAFNTAPAQTLESFDKVEALLEARDATLWIEHSKALADSLRKSPYAYQ